VDGCLIVVGCSWGGLEALGAILAGLPTDTGATVVMAQHRLPRRAETADLLSRRSAWPVCEAADKDRLRPGVAFLAPGGYHLLVERDCLALSTEAPVAYSRPSIDVLFDSAAAAHGPRVIGVVLTGSNHDGAAGLTAVVARGGRAIVQDPGTAERAAMPQAALAAVPKATVLPLDQIGPHLARLCEPATEPAP
jgi:two-component system chemotaxis response regulator CheB